MSDLCPEDLVRSVIDPLVRKWQWQLTAVDELVAGVCKERPADKELTPTLIGYLARGEYGRCLYAAAQGVPEGTQVGKSSGEVRRRQERAYTEVGIYLYAIARGRNYNHDHVQEAVQAALVRIYSRLEECRNPAAFLHWCWLQLRETLRQPEPKPGIELDDESDESEGRESGETADPGAIDPAQRAICVSLWRQFLERIAAMCAGKAKRATDQIAMVLLKFLVGMTDDEIAEQHGLTMSALYSLRSRGLDRLSGDRELLQIVQALRASGCTSIQV